MKKAVPDKKRNRQKVNKIKEKFSGLHKYRTIIISVALFLFFDLSILGINYYQSLKVSGSAISINIASRQASLAQDIAKNLNDINLIAERDFSADKQINVPELKKEVFKQFNALKFSSTLFNQSLNSLTKGGKTDNLTGEIIDLDPIQIPSAVNNLNTIIDIWTPYKGLIDSFILSYERGDVQLNNIQFAADYARIYTTRLLTESNDVASALQDKAEEQANFLKWVQIIGIFIAVSIFFFIVFRALGQLLRSDFELTKSRRETTEIMNTIQEGLFLINDQYIVGEQQSEKLQHIFPVKNIAGKKFDEILEGIITEKDITNTRRFINQLFNRKVRENLIDDLNPLRRVLIRHEKKNGTISESYLRFHFARSYEGKRIKHILVSITDVTEAVELELRLQKEREQSEMHLEMLMKLLRIKPEVLDGFMQNANVMTDKINLILRKSGSSQMSLKGKVNDIFREVHSFKGEASALELDGFVDIAETMENKLESLRTKNNITGNDFLSVAMELNRFFSLNQEIDEMRHRLVNMSALDVSAKQSESLNHYFTNLAKNVAERNGKEVVLNVQGFDDLKLPYSALEKVKIVAVQLLRNAIAHGIETPTERIAQGKNKVGTVQLHLTQQGDQWQMLVADDGGGIRFDALREKLVTLGLKTEEEAANLSEKELYRALFLSGLSTKEESNEDAGRGVGMDVVKDRIQQLKGKIDIRSEAGKFSRFMIRFPA